MYKKLSVLVPTRNRIGRLRTLLDSYLTTTAGVSCHSEILFRVDDDDVESYKFLTAAGFPALVGPRLGGYNSMPTFFNELYKWSSGDVLMSGNDDFIFKTHGWAPKILESASRFPDGIFNVGVRTLNEDHYPFGITSRKMADALGFYWDPRIFWGDIYLRDVVAAFGRCFKLPEVEIVHDWAGNNPDQVFNESDKNIVGRDPHYWSVTNPTAVNEAVAKLKAMMIMEVEKTA